MTQNKTLFATELGISGISEKLYGMSNPELIELREKIETILQEHEEAVTPKPEEEEDWDVKLEDIEFADDALSVREAALFADLFDEIGDFHNASLMDDYISKWQKPRAI